MSIVSLSDVKMPENLLINVVKCVEGLILDDKRSIALAAWSRIRSQQCPMPNPSLRTASKGKWGLPESLLWMDEECSKALSR